MREKELLFLEHFECGLYFCNENGEVFSKNSPHGMCSRIRKLKPYMGNSGYPLIRIGTGSRQYTFQVHRFIYLYFHRYLDPTKTINHIDGNKRNNKLSNLEEITLKENAKHAHKNGLVNVAKGERSAASKFKEADILKIREDHAAGAKAKILAIKYDTHIDNIYAIVNRETWKHI